MTKRAAIYTRVSSKGQAGEDKTSLESQLAQCRKLAEENGFEVAAELRDIRTGTDGKRKGYLELVRMMENDEVDAVVAWREDRLYRGLFAVLPFYKAVTAKPDLKVLLVMESFDRSMMGIKASMAQIELETKDQRTEDGIRNRMRQGKPSPGPKIKFGYRKNEEGFAEVHPENATYVKEMFRLYVSGHTGREIMDGLKAKGCNRKFDRQGVVGRIKDETYRTGIQRLTRKAGGVEETFEVKYPPLIDDVTWAAAQKVLASRRSRYRGHYMSYPSLLGGLVRCEAHGLSMSMRNARRKNSAYYRCSGNSKQIDRPKNHDCAGSYKVPSLDQSVWEEVCAFVNSPTRIAEVVDARAGELGGSIRGNVEEEIVRHTKRLHELEEKATRLINFFGEGKSDEERLSLQLTNIDFEKAAVQRELATAESELMVQLEPEAIKEATRNLLSGTEWKAARNENFQDDLEGARKLVRQVLEKVSIGPGFEYVGENGETEKTPKVPTMHFRIEVPGIYVGELLEIGRVSAYVEGADDASKLLGFASRVVSRRINYLLVPRHPINVAKRVAW